MIEREVAKVQETLRREMNRVFDFLGLCRIATMPTHQVHPTSKKGHGGDMVLNSTLREQVTEWFRPFNALMSHIEGVTAAAASP